MSRPEAVRIARRAAALAPSATLALQTQAARLRAAGRDVVSLALGEPDFGPAPHAAAAAIAAIEQERTQATVSAGMPALREALADKLRAAWRRPVGVDEVIVGAGTKPLLHAALLALCEAGDEVILPMPYWVSYPALIRAVGATVRYVPTAAVDGFVLHAQALARSVTPATRVLLLNTPANPSGAVYSPEQLAALAVVLRAHPRLHVVSDEIYEDLNYLPQGHVSFAAVAPDLRERTVVVSGFSKGHGMIGWRLGYAAGPAGLVRAMDNVLGHLVGAPSTLAQHAAIASLGGPDDVVASRRADYARRRDVALDALRAIPGLQATRPDGAFFVLVDCRALLGRALPGGGIIGDDEAFVREALEYAGVLLAPGSAFGAAGFVRVAYSVAPPILAEGLRRLRRFCEALG